MLLIKASETVGSEGLTWHSANAVHQVSAEGNKQKIGGRSDGKLM